MRISTVRTQFPRTRRAAVGALALALLGSTGLAVAGHAVTGTPAGTGALSATTTLGDETSQPTVFRLTSFNLLGASHTAPGGDRKGWATGAVRMGWAAELLHKHEIDVAGFQEMQKPQFRKFVELESANYDIFPGLRYGTAALANSISWRRDTWTLLETRMIEVPYFRGNMIRKPLVRLGNLQTGQEAWFFNTHNPSNTRGPAQKWRDRAVQIQVDMVNALRTETPDVPVLFTGDMNDREKFFCPITAQAPLHAANGGSNVDGQCTPPVPTKIDWILGTPDVSFSDYVALDDEFVNKTTDHPMVMATASVAPLTYQRATIKRVLAISIEGLRASAVRQAGPEEAPAFHRMIGEGASTLNARTATERTTTLPNVVSMLTGRRIKVNRGGHGVARGAAGSGTVAAASGRYVSSVFDLVHNFGLGTALFTSEPALSMVDQSWDAVNGGPDPYGADDGRDKIDVFVQVKRDERMVKKLVRSLVQQPAAFTFAEFSALGETGRAKGWRSAAYAARFRDVDAMLGRILAAIEMTPELADSTLVLLTADSGGKGHDHKDKTLRPNYTVPFLAWGQGVAAGADLYALNPTLVDPGRARVGYGAAQPVRNGFLANLATGALGLPALPGSGLNQQQDFTVFADTAEPPAEPPAR